MFLIWVGSEFQAAGPATANGPSSECVLVRRTVKSPRTDDRRRTNYCVLFSSRITVSIRFSVWLVSGYAHVFLQLSVVIATLVQSGMLPKIGPGSSRSVNQSGELLQFR